MLEEGLQRLRIFHRIDRLLKTLLRCAHMCTIRTHAFTRVQYSLWYSTYTCIFKFCMWPHLITYFIFYQKVRLVLQYSVPYIWTHLYFFFIYFFKIYFKNYHQLSTNTSTSMFYMLRNMFCFYFIKILLVPE